MKAREEELAALRQRVEQSRAEFDALHAKVGLRYGVKRSSRRTRRSPPRWCRCCARAYPRGGR